MSRWKQGDTKPDMVIDCFDGSGRKAPLSEAAFVRVIVRQAGVVKWQRNIPPATVVDGTVTLELTEDDTAEVGTFYVKVYAEWPDGSRQHYPPGDEYMTMTVTR